MMIELTPKRRAEIAEVCKAIAQKHIDGRFHGHPVEARTHLSVFVTDIVPSLLAYIDQRDRGAAAMGNTTTPTDEQLAAWERVANGATAGPWRTRVATSGPRSITAAAIGQPGDIGIGFDGESGPNHLNMIGEVWAERVRGRTDAYQASADAEFICTAREAFPQLIALVRRLRAAAGAVTDEKADAVIDALDEYGRGVDHYDYGLPRTHEATIAMRLLVRQALGQEVHSDV